MENPPDPRPDVPEALLQQRMLALHARLATSVLPFSAVISSLIWFFYRNDIQPWWTLPTWWSLNNLVSLWRLRQFRQYAASPERRSVREWSRRFITGAALAGGIWGASGLLLYTPDNIALQTILPLILMGVATSGMVSLTSLLPAYLWFFGLMLLPNVIAFALRNTFTDQLVALALALFVVSLIFNGKRVAGVSRANNLLQLQLSRALEEANSARHAAEQASEAKSRFLATMSHEIRTPMNGVLGMCQLLTLTPLDSSQREYLRTLENSGQHLLGLIDDVLDFSRIEAGRMELDIQAFSPRELLEDLATLMFPRGRAKGLDCRLEITGELSPTLAGDAGRIRQVLLNLIGNAIKFTGSGSVTLIASETEGATPGLRVLKLVVNDTGIGISGQDQDRIFDAFTQADNSHARRFGGSGLGLAIVRELTSLLGGTIHVDSAPGKGSRFTLDLPCRSAPANRRAPPPTPTLSGCVLLVEDSLTNQLVASNCLNRLGLTCEVADSGEQALEMQSDRYRAVLMDCGLPGMDGYEVTRRWRAREQADGTPAVPIIALTADVVTGTRELCLAAGMNDYLIKPFRFDQLAACLHNALGRAV